MSRTLLAVFAPRVLRVSAAARRGAAAYADGAQRMVRARTHQSGLVSPPQSEIRSAARLAYAKIALETSDSLVDSARFGEMLSIALDG